MRKTKAAFLWIVGKLERDRVPFRITGGFAVRIYGSERELADIDIEIPGSRLDFIYAEVAPYTVFGPRIYRDRNWRIRLITLRYKGQEIDICAAGTARIYDKSARRWVRLNINPHDAVRKKVFGKIVRVTRAGELIRYKSKLRRRVDLKDVEFLKKKLGVAGI